MSVDSTPVAQAERILERCPRLPRGDRFVVVCPVYNRRQTLPRALDSLLAQTYRNWLCLVLDDGSTDGTLRIGEAYARRDPRFIFTRFEENRGGVVMNEIGMRVACELGEYWSRLGSDDWFEPHKLSVDHVTLGGNDLPACFGPYRYTHDHLLDRLLASRGVGILRAPSRIATSWLNATLRGQAVRDLRRRFGTPYEPLQSPPSDARAALLSGRFAMSWANVATRTEVLRAVLERYGSFCHPDSRNMEDMHCNARMASVASIAWRGLMKDRETVVIGAQSWSEAGDESEFMHDATWRMAADGASSNRLQMAIDAKISQAAIEADLATHPPQPCPVVGVRVARLLSGDAPNFSTCAGRS